MDIQERTNKLDSKFWRIIFLIAGLYTAGGVLPGIIDPQNGVLEFFKNPEVNMATVFFFRSLWMTVFVFGIGYLIVALRPAANTGIVTIGLIGKLIFAINVFYHYALGLLTDTALMAASVDIIFVILFGTFLYKARVV